MRRNGILAIIVVAVLVLYLGSIAVSTTANFSRLTDDAYYYFQIGRNMARGLGPTFDGEHFTNGYHPFWMGITALVYRLIPDRPILPIVVLRVLELLLFVGTLLILWRVLKRITDNAWLAGGLLALYAFNPYNLRWAIDGLETSLVLFLFAAFFLVFVNLLDDRDSLKKYWLMGALGGLMALGRTDYGVFAAVAFIYLALTEFKKPAWFSKMIALGLPAIGLVAPWLIYNYLSFGTPVQESGLAGAILAHDWFFSKARTGLETALWSAYQFSLNIIRALTHAGLPIPKDLKPIPTLIEITAIAGAIGLSIKWFLKNRREQFLNAFVKNILGRAVLISAAGLLLINFANGGLRWTSRSYYYITAPFLLIIILALILEKVFEIKTWPKRKITAAGLLIFAAFAINAWWYDGRDSNFYRNWVEEEPVETIKYQATQWMNANLPADARVASFNSGITGYFTNRFVMNADGKVNHEAYLAMKNKKPLWEFFEKNKIQYLADSESVITDARAIWLGVKDPLTHLQPLASYPNDLRPRLHYDVYHIRSYQPYEIYDHPRYGK